MLGTYTFGGLQCLSAKLPNCKKLQYSKVFWIKEKQEPYKLQIQLL